MRNNLLLGLSLALMLSSVPSELLAAEAPNPVPVQQIAQDDVKGQLVNAFRQTANWVAEEAAYYQQHPEIDWECRDEYISECIDEVEPYNQDANQLEQANGIAGVINIFFPWVSVEGEEMYHRLQNVINPGTRATSAAWLRDKFYGWAGGYFSDHSDEERRIKAVRYYFIGKAFDNISGHGPITVNLSSLEGHFYQIGLDVMNRINQERADELEDAAAPAGDQLEIVPNNNQAI